MIDPLAWGAVIVPTTAVALSAWIAGRHNHKAADHATDSSAIVKFNGQLLEERQHLVSRLDRLGEHIGEKVDAVQIQVANGHTTNLRDDLSKAIDMVIELKGDMRLMRAEVGYIADDVREVRTDLNTLEQRVIEGGSS